MKYSEQIAKTVIEMLCVGSEMRFRRDQSTSVPDFDLRYANETVAVVEVTESVDQIWLETTRAVEAKYRVEAKKCRDTWAVHLRSDANPKNLRLHIDEALAQFESAGYRQFPLEREPENWQSVVPIYDLIRRLGVDVAMVVEARSPTPFIGILTPGRGGVVSTGILRQAIEAEANKRDNKQKLSPFGDRERHLFVYIDSRNFLPWRVVVSQRPPLEVPSIPHEITHIWIAAIPDSGNKAVVWKAERGKNWQSLGEVPIPPQEKSAHP
jgi:hypothetical protein